MSPNPSVLVADDDEDLRLLFQVQLQLVGFQISQAADGEQAIEVARRDRPDLILLDLMMPVMDGWECLAELKADPILREIPVFVITGKSQQQDRDQAFAMGADDYFSKPFQAKELIARINAQLQAA